MASTSKEVAKSLVLVAVDRRVTKQEADEIRADMEMKFTHDRGPTQMGAAQGEHATAYALYVEFVMTIVGRYISAAQDNSYRGITTLLEEMKARPQQDNDLLVSFGLKPSNIDAFEELDEKIKGLQGVFNGRVSAHAANIKAMQGLKAQSSQGLPAAIVAGIEALNPDALKIEINTIRGEYFFTIAQKIAEEYLLFQNKSLHVAFRKVPGQEADSGEGARIAAALKMLRDSNRPGLGLASAATSSRASLTRGARAASVETAVDDRIKIIVENINKLLFYPKVDEAEVSATTAAYERKGVLRSNDPSIFCYVVARHLSIIFATFEELGKDQGIKDKIIDQVIDLKTKEWDFDANTAARLKAAIVSALKAADRRQSHEEIEPLNVSLLESSPLKVQPVTAGVGVSQRTTTPLYNRVQEGGSEAAKTPSKAPPAQGSTSTGPKTKKKWW